VKVRQININDFPPTKPEKDGIRYLRGKRADAFSKAWDETNVALVNGPISYFLLDIWRKFTEKAGFNLNYFDNRHCYNPMEKRLLDIMYIQRYNYFKNKRPDVKQSFIYVITCKYIKFRYRAEEKRIYYWSQIWVKGSKHNIYVWHEDIEKYRKKYHKKRMSDAQRDEIEAKLYD